MALWLGNDEGLYNVTREMARDADVNEPNDISSGKYELATTLRGFVEDIAEQTCPGVIEGASFVADLFQAALSEVDWVEIAENLIGEVTEYQDA